MTPEELTIYNAHCQALLEDAQRTHRAARAAGIREDGVLAGIRLGQRLAALGVRPQDVDRALRRATHARAKQAFSGTPVEVIREIHRHPARVRAREHGQVPCRTRGPGFRPGRVGRAPHRHRGRPRPATGRDGPDPPEPDERRAPSPGALPEANPDPAAIARGHIGVPEVGRRPAWRRWVVRLAAEVRRELAGHDPDEQTAILRAALELVEGSA